MNSVFKIKNSNDLSDYGYIQCHGYDIKNKRSQTRQSKSNPFVYPNIILNLLHSSNIQKWCLWIFFWNPMSLIFTISAIALVFIIKILVRKSTAKKRRYHPIGGTVINQLMNFDRLHHYMIDLAGKCRYHGFLGFDLLFNRLRPTIQ